MEIKANDLFEQRIAGCNEKQRELRKEKRSDEADFEKIKANILQIWEDSE